MLSPQLLDLLRLWARGQAPDRYVIQVLLRHSKLDATALYTRVATKTIQAVASPIERLKLLMQGTSPSD